jgi:hypothetical protein
MNFCEYIKYYKIQKRIKKEKLRVGRIRPEAKGLLGAAAGCSSRPSRPHDPTGVAQQPLDPIGARAPPMVTARWPRARLVASNRAIRCGETGGDSSHRKRGRCWARRDRAGMHRGGDMTTGRRGWLRTVVFRWRGSPGDLQGPQQLHRGERRGEGVVPIEAGWHISMTHR